jgi:cell wall-associated NlpC family hydrolase
MAAVVATNGYARGVSDEDTLGDKIKRLFVGPSPSPTKHRKKPAAKPTPKKPGPTTSPAGSPPSPSPSAPPTETPSPSRPEPGLTTETQTVPPQTRSSPSRVAKSVPPSTAEFSDAQSQYLEPVRPINPGPNARHTPRPKPAATGVAKPAPTTTPETKPTESPAAAAKPTPPAKKAGSATATISTGELAGYQNYSPNITKIVDVSMGLTNQNLGYKYNSAEPAKGGMDSSGFVQYVLTQAGIKDAPRDARDQYIWVRKAENFQAVLSQRDDSFELDALKPGDLLFWATPFSVSREPEITQTMIYLGRDKSTNQRLMVGANERRPFKGQLRSGVSVFDFKVARPKSEKEANAVFVGYGRVPGLSAE